MCFQAMVEPFGKGQNILAEVGVSAGIGERIFDADLDQAVLSAAEEGQDGTGKAER